MTFQEILEGITRHRALAFNGSPDDILRKLSEIEWALHAIAEKLAETKE